MAIHLHYHKENTENLAILEGPRPAEVVIPLLQHIGVPAEPVVAIGDKVLAGQLIGQAKGAVSANVHASVSGEVLDISLQPHPINGRQQAITIKNDELYQYHPDIKPYPALEELAPEQIIAAARDGGLVGLGGATFPTHIKLTPPGDKSVDILLINGAECEPFLTADDRIMQESAEAVIYGALAAAKALNVQKIFIAVEDNTINAIRALKKAAPKRVKIVTLKTRYPQGAEKVLVKTVTKRQVPGLGISLDVGVAILNAGTVAQLAQTLRTGQPLISRVVTVVGHIFISPGNYRVLLGTRFQEFLKDKKTTLDSANDDKLHKIVMGGPMMGLAQSTLEVPVIKGTSGILSLTPYRFDESPCIRCGRCVAACPLGLMPLYDGDDSCMECGCCAYVCPAKIPLVQKLRLAKNRRRQQNIRSAK